MATQLDEAAERQTWRPSAAAKWALASRTSAATIRALGGVCLHSAIFAVARVSSIVSQSAASFTSRCARPPTAAHAAPARPRVSSLDGPIAQIGERVLVGPRTRARAGCRLVVDGSMAAALASWEVSANVRLFSRATRRLWPSYILAPAPASAFTQRPLERRVQIASRAIGAHKFAPSFARIFCCHVRARSQRVSTLTSTGGGHCRATRRRSTQRARDQATRQIRAFFSSFASAFFMALCAAARHPTVKCDIEGRRVRQSTRNEAARFAPLLAHIFFGPHRRRFPQSRRRRLLACFLRAFCSPILHGDTCERESESERAMLTACCSRSMQRAGANRVTVGSTCRTVRMASRPPPSPSTTAAIAAVAGAAAGARN